MALWGGRFASGPHESVFKLSRSVDFDWRLAPYDVRVNMAHVAGLQRAGIINGKDGALISSALIELAHEIESGAFSVDESVPAAH